MKKVLVMVGTRPEAIKMVSLYKKLKDHSDLLETLLVSTGQHKEMLYQALSDFGVKPDIDLHIMTQNQTLSGMSARLFESVDQLFEKEKPDLVLVQGDTTTVMVASLCAFYKKIKIGHVEAGLRSHDINLPFPEELNRRVTGLVADWHFAPTKLSKDNLLKEGVKEKSICISGNTVIDSLLYMSHLVKVDPPKVPDELQRIIDVGHKIILVTGHRRESIGRGFEQICEAIKQIASSFPDVRIVYPVHFNPMVRKTVMQKLGDQEGVVLIDPLPYKEFVYLMNKSYLILTDSGGIQEEGPSIGKPVLIMRDVTERPEGVEAGVNFLVGTNGNKIFTKVSEFLLNDFKYKEVQRINNPYGDGKACEKIVKFLLNNI